MRLQQTIQVLAALTLLSAGTAASAQKPQEGDTALFVNNISTLPTYNLGYFLNDDVMGYGALGVTSDDNESGFALGLGARVYGAPGTSEHIRTYWNAGFSYAGEGFYRADSALASLGGLARTGARVTETLGLRADFGAEAELAPRLTIGAEVGLLWQDVETTNNNTGNSTSNSILSLGTAALTLNYYF